MDETPPKPEWWPEEMLPGLPNDLVPTILCLSQHAYGVCRAWDAVLAACNGDDHYYFAVVRHLRTALATRDWSGYRRLLRLEPCRLFEADAALLNPAQAGCWEEVGCARIGRRTLAAREDQPWGHTSSLCGLPGYEYCPGDVVRRSFGLVRLRWGARARIVHEENTDLCALHDAIVLGVLCELPGGGAAPEPLGAYFLTEDVTGELRFAADWQEGRIVGRGDECTEVRYRAGEPLVAEPRAAVGEQAALTASIRASARFRRGGQAARARPPKDPRSERAETALERLCDRLLSGRHPDPRFGHWAAVGFRTFIEGAAQTFIAAFDAMLAAADEQFREASARPGSGRLAEHAKYVAGAEAELGLIAAAPPGIESGPLEDKPFRPENLDNEDSCSSDAEWFAAAMDNTPEIGADDTRELMKALIDNGYFSGEGEEYLPGYGSDGSGDEESPECPSGRGGDSVGCDG